LLYTNPSNVAKVEILEIIFGMSNEFNLVESMTFEDLEERSDKILAGLSILIKDPVLHKAFTQYLFIYSPRTTVKLQYRL
jgi:hypothetical protein